VDDSPETLGFLTEALEQSGFSVLIATSGARRAQHRRSDYARPRS
jgi:DNA-binding response OmpR family regulator